LVRGVDGGKGEAGLEGLMGFFLFAQGEVGAAEFEMVQDTARLEGDDFLKIFVGFFIRGVRELPMDGLGQSFQDWIEVGEFVVPAWKKSQARGGSGFLPDQAGECDLATGTKEEFLRRLRTDGAKSGEKSGREEGGGAVDGRMVLSDAHGHGSWPESIARASSVGGTGNEPASK
jgi:hypothetical protein